jgi:hypothetical protein
MRIKAKILNIQRGEEKNPYIIEPLILLCLLSALPHQNPRIRTHATAITVEKKSH